MRNIEGAVICIALIMSIFIFSECRVHAQSTPTPTYPTPIPTPVPFGTPNETVVCIPALMMPNIAGKAIYCCYTWRGSSNVFMTGWVKDQCVGI